MKKFTLINDFHDTRVSIVPKGVETEDGDTQLYISKTQMRRAKKALCGVKSCGCPKVSAIYLKEKKITGIFMVAVIDDHGEWTGDSL